MNDVDWAIEWGSIRSWCEPKCGEWGQCNPCRQVVGAAVAFGLMGMAEAIRQRCTCPPAIYGFPLTWNEVCERCKGYP